MNVRVFLNDLDTILFPPLDCWRKQDVFILDYPKIKSDETKIDFSFGLFELFFS